MNSSEKGKPKRFILKIQNANFYCTLKSVLQRRNMSYWNCSKCNEIFLPYLEHCCKAADFLPYGMSATNSNFQFSTREINNAQLVSFLSDEICDSRKLSDEKSVFGNRISELEQEASEPPEEATLNIELANTKLATTDAELPSVESPTMSDGVHHQIAIYNSDFSNIGSYVEIETSESQEEIDLNRDFVNITDGGNGRLPHFGLTVFSSGHGKCNYGIPNPSRKTSYEKSGFGNRSSELEQETSEPLQEATMNNEFANMKIATKSHGLKDHSVVYTGLKSFEWDVCKKGFSRKRDLKIHSIVHTKPESLECDVCKKRFSKKANLKQHVVVHIRHRSYECDVCKKLFLRRGDLKKHSVVHTGHKSFESNVSKKFFLRKEHLKQHSVVHTGHKSFECDVCKKLILRKVSLKMRSHTHLEDKLFKCEKCGRDYKRPGNLKIHLSKCNE